MTIYELFIQEHGRPPTEKELAAMQKIYDEVARQRRQDLLNIVTSVVLDEEDK